MKLDETQLKELRRLGAALRTIPDAALIMEIEESELRHELNNKTSEVYKAYFGGREETMTLVMENVILQAKRGSSSAQDLVMKFYKKIQIDEA